MPPNVMRCLPLASPPFEAHNSGTLVELLQAAAVESQNGFSFEHPSNPRF
jgi:hypothetical protein